MDVAGTLVAVLGLGKSGRAAATLLSRKGARVVANDRKSAEALDQDIASLRSAGVDLRLGADDPSIVDAADLLVVSPGVPENDVLRRAQRLGVPMVSEVELASWWIGAPVVGVTGTNGKSTVTSLVARMLGEAGFATFEGGNLGTPLCDVVGTAAGGPDGRVVCELSSYQLERVPTFRCRVSVLLNVTPDHLDRYPSFEAYADAKGNVFAHQREQDHAVVPAGDPLCEQLAARGRAKLHDFGDARGSEVGVDAGALLDRATGDRYPLESLRMRGWHNVLNAAASILAARLAGAPADAIARALGGFAGLPHRMQLVATLDGVDFFDDSKATNVAAALAAIDGLTQRVVLIAGGVGKGGSYAPLVERLRTRGRAVVTLGEAAPLIEQALGDAIAFERATTMVDAVERARRIAEPGDAVLLAPACASFDMFTSYAHRGDTFRSAVLELRHGGQR